MSVAISVLMPMHNAAATLPATLASLTAQTLADFELVVVDDGSTDGSLEITRDAWRAAVHPAKSRRPLVTLAPGRVGLVAALNLGLVHCQAPLIARMDADDLAAPERLLLQARYLNEEHPEVGIVGCRVRCFCADDATGDAPPAGGFALYEEWLNSTLTHADMMRELFVESPLAHPSVMLRRAVLLELGGYRDAGWPEDYDLWLRAAAAGVRFGKVDQVLLHWRDYPERTSRRDPAYAPPAFLRCKAHFLAAGPLRGRRRVAVWGAGAVGRRLGRLLTAAAVPLCCYVDIDPRKVGRTRQGLPIIAPEALPRAAPDFIIAVVGSRGARALIRGRLGEMGYREGEQFLCAA